MGDKEMCWGNLEVLTPNLEIRVFGAQQDDSSRYFLFQCNCDSTCAAEVLPS